MNVVQYIKELQSYEEFSFSWEELIQKCNKSEISLRRELSRLVERKEIKTLRRGFYLVIPPKYSKQKKLPIELYVEKLFKYLNKKYYLGFYSAAKFHGASHQKIQCDYIIVSPPRPLNINKRSIDLRFFSITNWPKNNIENKKSDAGYFKISSPALTAIDLIHYQKKLGGLNRILTVLEELTEEINQHDLDMLLSWYPHKSTLQRFGYFLERLHAGNELMEKLLHHLESINYYPVLLNPQKGRKAGAVANKWKVDVNLKLESDL